jgi:hypothetical protein
MAASLLIWIISLEVEAEVEAEVAAEVAEAMNKSIMKMNIIMNNTEYNNLTYDVIFIFFLYSYSYIHYAFRFRFVVLVLFLEPCLGLEIDTVFVFSRDNASLFTAYVTGSVFMSLSLLSLAVEALSTMEFISIGLISMFSIECEKLGDLDRDSDRRRDGNLFRTLIFLRFI